MNIGRSLKKLGKHFESPFMFLSMFGPWGILAGSALSIGDTKRKAYIKSDKKEQSNATIAMGIEDNSYERAFNERLEKERKKSARSSVVYAGLLKKNERSGLGGPKTLLGI